MGILDGRRDLRLLLPELSTSEQITARDEDRWFLSGTTCFPMPRFDCWRRRRSIVAWATEKKTMERTRMPAMVAGLRSIVVSDLDFEICVQRESLLLRP